MPSIHLMTGFIGFGKTTIAKMLEKRLPAMRFTHDEIMCERYGRAPADFQEKYKLVDDYIKAKAEECVNSGKNVILDYGFWTHESREQYYNWAKKLTDDVVFHLVKCDINEAKRRVLARTKNDDAALMIDENIFDELLKRYEPWSAQDDYPLVWHNAESIIEQKVKTEQKVKSGLNKK
jgi:predicted kinase